MGTRFIFALFKRHHCVRVWRHHCNINEPLFLQSARTQLAVRSTRHSQHAGGLRQAGGPRRAATSAALAGSAWPSQAKPKHVDSRGDRRQAGRRRTGCEGPGGRRLGREIQARRPAAGAPRLERDANPSLSVVLNTLVCLVSFGSVADLNLQEALPPQQNAGRCALATAPRCRAHLRLRLCPNILVILFCRLCVPPPPSARYDAPQAAPARPETQRPWGWAETGQAPSAREVSCRCDAQIYAHVGRVKLIEEAHVPGGTPPGRPQRPSSDPLLTLRPPAPLSVCCRPRAPRPRAALAWASLHRPPRPLASSPRRRSPPAWRAVRCP